ncbi:DUF423 domain-containing protein [uncultured Lacinutrix sp.]|uniref:DUF423 domain-containing protein n=1 Tax=uncultured Lacinutrix sp. TaxID=574032 RepID=UPI00261E1388|nr:DUF423 domain-containing protein [uncultured Lacinutrix sp.]
MNRKILILATIFGLLAVVIGAFAAHGLKPLLSVDAMQSFETGVRYQMYHALLLLFIGVSKILSIKTRKIIYYLVGAGVFFFSGSIYLLATNTLSTIDFKVIGFITPIGGVLLIAAWIVLLISFLKSNKIFEEIL